MTEIFRSSPADCDDVWGFMPISDDVEITKLPIHDTRANILAHMGAADFEELFEPRGWYLPSDEEYDAHFRISLWIEPFTLPTEQMVRAAGIPETEAAIEAFRVAHMMGLAWCTMHDAEAMRRAVAAGFNGAQGVSNFGKHWSRPTARNPARTGRALIYGWYLSRPSEPVIRVIQPPNGEAHDPRYGDYGTTAHACRKRTR